MSVQKSYETLGFADIQGKLTVMSTPQYIQNWKNSFGDQELFKLDPNVEYTTVDGSHRLVGVVIPQKLTATATVVDGISHNFPEFFEIQSERGSALSYFSQFFQNSI